MKGFSSPFTRQDLLTIRWPLLTLSVSICMAALAFILIHSLQTESQSALRAAQQNLSDTRQAIAELEAETEAMERYAGRYARLARQAVITPEDRIGLLETVAEIRSRHHLFPVNVSIGEQSGMRLSYPPSAPYPGGPVDLHFSRIDLSLPLLHEGDLLRLLQDLHGTTSLFQTERCQLQRNTDPEQGYQLLARHFNARCTLLWYTFSLPDSTSGVTPGATP